MRELTDSPSTVTGRDGKTYPTTKTKATRAMKIKMEMTPSQMLVVCFMAAAGAQLDRRRLVKDMRRMAGVLVESAPELAAHVDVIIGMCDLVENVGSVLGGTAAKVVIDGPGSSVVH